MSNISRSSEVNHLLSSTPNDDDARDYGCNDESSFPASSSTATLNTTSTIANERRHKNGRRREGLWRVILFGQTIALALSCGNAASSTLENRYQIRAPTFLVGLVYFILSFHLVRLFSKHRIRRNDYDRNNGGGGYESIEDAPCERYDGRLSGARQVFAPTTSSGDATMVAQTRPPPGHNFPFTTLPLHTPWHTYLLLSILDVEANYLAMLSFQHTSLSSSMLLTSLSVLSTVVLRRLILRNASYGRMQLLGIVMCTIGGCLWLREEYYDERNVVSAAATTSGDGYVADGLHRVRGDLLALCAATLYGLNDVLAERFIKASDDRAEYLGMIGLFGATFSFAVQVPLLEGGRLPQLLAGLSASGCSAGVAFYFACFIVMLVYFYNSVMAFLSAHDATILNLSLQSCPLWAVVLTALQRGLCDGSGGWEVPPVMFFVSLTMVILGMFLYERHEVLR